MKKNVFLIIVVAFFCLNISAQGGNFGIKAGVDFATVKVAGLSASETGFFVGAFTTINLSESILLQPELLYVSIKDLDFLSLPLLLKFSVAENLNLLAGPSLNYFLDMDEDEFKVNLDFGASYDIGANLDINAKYSLGLGDVDVNGVFIGLGYKF